MPILVEALHNAFLQEANYTNSKYLKELSAAQIDFYLNRAKDNLIEYWSGLSENNDFVRQQLRQVTIRDKVLKGKIKEDKYLVSFPPDMLKPLKIYAVASKDKCPSRRLVVRRLPSQKIDRALKNPNLNRFWDFEETIGMEQSDGFAVFHGGLKVEKLVLDYIRKVQDVCNINGENAETYIKFSGGNPTQTNFEIDSTFLSQKVVALAVLYAKRDAGEVQNYQTQLQTILQIDRVF